MQPANRRIQGQGRGFNLYGRSDRRVNSRHASNTRIEELKKSALSSRNNGFY